MPLLHCGRPYGAAFVRDAVTNQPVCDANVTIDGSTATPFGPSGATACYYGAYRGTGKPPTTMTVRVSRSGYYDVEVKTTSNPATIVIDPVR